MGKLDAIIVGVMVFSLFVVAGSLIWNDVIDNYKINTTTESEGANFSGVYNTMDSFYNLSGDVQDATLYGEIESGSNSWDSLISGSYNALRYVTLPFALVNQITFAITNQLHIPRIFAAIAITAFYLILLFAVIYMVFRFKG